MVSTHTGNEPMTTTDLAPTDVEIFPGGYHNLGLEFNSPRGHDPSEVADDIQERIIRALHEVGEHEIAGRLR